MQRYGYLNNNLSIGFWAAEIKLILKFQPDVVVNCAALSVPRACEVDPDAAMSINVPSSLVKWLLSFETNDTLLIHLSTDQGLFHWAFSIWALYIFIHFVLASQTNKWKNMNWIIALVQKKKEAFSRIIKHDSCKLL